MADEIRALKERVVSAFALPSAIFGLGECDVPCGPGGYCARIEFDAHGPVLNSQVKREEYALAMEERIVSRPIIRWWRKW